MCKASHPSPSVGFAAAHSLYMTLHDARMIGNERCRKPGPTHTLCDICWHVDRCPRRELSSHTLADCPYSQIVTDPILRSLLASYAKDPSDRSSWLTAPPSTIAEACARLLHSGSNIGLPVPVPAPVAASIAGCISTVLFSRASSNAPPLPNPTRFRIPRPLSFSPYPPYQQLARLIHDRLDHTRRRAIALDDRLIVLHPGIEAWLGEHGHYPEWEKQWGPLDIPLTLDQAPVGSSGALGLPSSPTVVIPTLTLSLPAPQPSPPARVSLRLAVGPRIGSLDSPADPTTDAWPLSPHDSPSYAIDHIIGSRVSASRGPEYLIRWLHRPDQSSWEPAASLADTTALDHWLMRPRGPHTVPLRGDRPRLESLLASPRLPPTRAPNLRNLLRAMDPHGVTMLLPQRPNTIGLVPGGRTTYCDHRGVGNAFLTCNATARAFVYGMHWDEIDISRSHFSSVLGSWTLTQRPRTVSHIRFHTDQSSLEGDLASELRAAAPHRAAELAARRAAASGVPTPRQAQLIHFATRALAKCSMKPKHVMSAMINTKNPDSWRIPFEAYPTLMQLLDDILTMRPAVLKHPLCLPLASAHLATGTSIPRTISICLGHLDDASLSAAAGALSRAGCLTGPTVNDSLLLYSSHSPDPATVLHLAIPAASSLLGFPVSFSFLPSLMKPTDPPPRLPPPSLRSQASPLPPPPQTPARAPHTPPPLPPLHPPGTATGGPERVCMRERARGNLTTGWPAVAGK